MLTTRNMRFNKLNTSAVLLKDQLLHSAYLEGRWDLVRRLMRGIARVTIWVPGITTWPPLTLQVWSACGSPFLMRERNHPPKKRLGMCRMGNAQHGASFLEKKGDHRPQSSFFKGTAMASEKGRPL